MSTDDRFQRMMAKKRNDTKVEQIIGRCSYRRYDEQIHVLHQHQDQEFHLLGHVNQSNQCTSTLATDPHQAYQKMLDLFFFCSSTHVLFMTCMHSIKTDTILVCVHF